MTEAVVEAVVEPVIEPVVEPAVIEPVVEPVAEVIEPIEAPKPPPPKWMLDRISEETRKRQQAEQATETERKGRTDAEALAARLQQNPNAQPAPRAEPQVDMVLVNQVANQQRMTEARQQIIRDGYAAFGGAKFDEAANILGAVGCVNDEFIADVLAVDRTNAHKTLAALAAEPETAARLANLDSRSRIAELTRITMAKAAPVVEPVVKIVPKVVSKAPAPAPIVEPSASKTVDGYADDATDEQFTKQFNARMKERTARR
jgi:hypothetical protein